MPKKTKLIFAERCSSKVIYVYDNDRYRWLTFDNEYIQSIILKAKPHLPALKYLPQLCLNLNTNFYNINNQLLVLGAGGGAIEHYLKVFYPHIKLTMVELESTIIEIAKSYFNTSQPILQADAVNYIQNTTLDFKHVFIDIFIDKQLPKALQSIEFLECCQQKAHQSLSINLVSENNEQIERAINLIRKVFDNRTLCLRVHGKNNVVIHAYNTKNYLEKIEQYYQDKLIPKPHWYSGLGLVC